MRHCMAGMWGGGSAVSLLCVALHLKPRDSREGEAVRSEMQTQTDILDPSRPPPPPPLTASVSCSALISAVERIPVAYQWSLTARWESANWWWMCRRRWWRLQVYLLQCIFPVLCGVRPHHLHLPYRRSCAQNVDPLSAHVFPLQSSINNNHHFHHEKLALCL